MSIAGNDIAGDPRRDTLINVNARGQAVSSARFMGGWEYEVIQQGHHANPKRQDIADILASSLMILPSVDPRSGPFQGRQMQWTGDEPDIGSGRRTGALSFYLALMTDTCLRLSGATGPVIVEGPFARNTEYLSMLMAATGRSVLTSEAATGTSIGAAMLMGEPSNPVEPARIGASWDLQALAAYANKWCARAGQD